jgi:hypothetical protein
MRELFIYYRLQDIDAALTSTLASRVREMQWSLQSKHRGLQARLLKRCATPDEWQTWMEIYAWPNHPGGVSQTLQEEIEFTAAAVLASWPGVQRHMEVFTSCA